MAHTVDNNFCHTTSTSITKYQLVPPSTDLGSPATENYCIVLAHYHPFCPFLPKTDPILPIPEHVPPSGDPGPHGTVFYSPGLTPKPHSTVTRQGCIFFPKIEFFIKRHFRLLSFLLITMVSF